MYSAHSTQDDEPMASKERELEEQRKQLVGSGRGCGLFSGGGSPSSWTIAQSLLAEPMFDDLADGYAAVGDAYSGSEVEKENEDNLDLAGSASKVPTHHTYLRTSLPQAKKRWVPFFPIRATFW